MSFDILQKVNKGLIRKSHFDTMRTCFAKFPFQTLRHPECKFFQKNEILN